MVAPATDQVASTFGIDNDVIKALTTSIFMLAYAIGPLFVGLMIEIYRSLLLSSDDGSCRGTYQMRLAVSTQITISESRPGDQWYVILPWVDLISPMVLVFVMIIFFFAQAHTHWIDLNIGITLVGAGAVLNFQCMQICIDCFTCHAVSGTFVYEFDRTHLTPSVFSKRPLFAPAMWSAPGLRKGTILAVAAIVILGCPVPSRDVNLDACSYDNQDYAILSNYGFLTWLELLYIPNH
ncbi:hypothetical protein EDB19DRAFT_1995582 [Suillus lakei]|nr:hypothetical protein EDB19DRAFT_1995582 [Suillus lakei]